MSAIEDIRAAAHAGDLERITRRANAFIMIAADASHEAHHYLAANLTPALRDTLVDRLASRMEMASEHDFTTWRVNIPGRFPHLIACMPHDAAEAAWKTWATRDVLACAWKLSKHEHDVFEDYEYPDDVRERYWEQLKDLWRVVDYGDMLEAQKQRRRVWAADDAHAPKEKRRVFAEAILDLWLDRRNMEMYDELR